ncbi:MAG TPA: DUF998 domain-containing protein [Tepidiformaceae bacterium]|nr:DUF998 domain-containing protein [Tepidiformaceae bacterium]
MQPQLTHARSRGRAVRPSRDSVVPGDVDGRPAIVRALVACGVLIPALYVAMDSIGAARYGGYSQKSGTISELSAIGAPTRRLWLILSVPFQLLSFLFAAGVLAVAGGRRLVRIIGLLLLGFAAVGPAWFVGPMHRREVLAAGGGTWQDTLHLVLGGINSAFFFALMGVGAAAFRGLFRVYSIASIAVVAIFGTLMGRDAPRVGRNEPTPWLGVTERITIFGSFLWFAAFAVALLRQGRNIQTD